MGPWKRRIAETIRQNYGVTVDKGFRPTSNARLQATFAEAKAFADALKRFDKQCTAHLKAVKDFNKQTHGFLSMSVPRMFKEPSTGEAEPSEAESMVGERVDFDKIEMSGAAGEEKIFRYVQEPLRKWLANFDTVVISLQQVEQLRLTLDSRRRSVSTMEGEMTNIQSRTTDPEDARLMKLVEKKHRQEMKMAQVLDDFRRKEATAYQNMRHLVNDVKYVRQHIAKLFELLRQVSSDVCDAFTHIDTALPQADAADGTSAYASGDSGGYGYSGNGITENGFSEHTGSASGRLPDSRTAPLGGDARFNERGGNHMDGPMSGKAGRLATVDRYGDHSAPIASGYGPV